MDAEDYKKWDASYQEAAGSMSSDRDFKVDQIADGLERDLELVGITAIEDKLQVSKLDCKGVIFVLVYHHE